MKRENTLGTNHTASCTGEELLRRLAGCGGSVGANYADTCDGNRSFFFGLLLGVRCCRGSERFQCQKTIKTSIYFPGSERFQH